MRVNSRKILRIVCSAMAVCVICLYIADSLQSTYRDDQMRAEREIEMSEKHLDRNIIRHEYIDQMSLCRALATEIMDPANRDRVNGYSEDNLVYQFCDEADKALRKGKHSSWDLLKQDAQWMISTCQDIIQSHSLRHYAQSRLNLVIRNYQEFVTEKL